MFIMAAGLLIAGIRVPKVLSVHELDEWFFVWDRSSNSAKQIDGGMLLAECAIIVGSCLLLSLIQHYLTEEVPIKKEKST